MMNFYHKKNYYKKSIKKCKKNFKKRNQYKYKLNKIII